MKDLIIIGAGGMGRETAWLVDRINCVVPTWNILGFVDENPLLRGAIINSHKILGGLHCLLSYPDAHIVCSIANAKVRKSVITKVIQLLPQTSFATLIDPSVVMSERVTIGEGSIVCANSIATIDIAIGKHVIINTACTIGHDAVLEDYVTVYPGVNISGNTQIKSCSELGTGMQIIQGKTIGANSVIGAGAVVIEDIPENCTAVGVPAKPVKIH